MRLPGWWGWCALAVAFGLAPGSGCSCQKSPGLEPDGPSPDGPADANVVADTPPPPPPDAEDRSPVKDGLGSPDQLIFEDNGVADPTAQIRALLALPIRDEAALDARLAKLYTPTDASFRAYLTAAAWNTTYAPTQADVDTLTAWLESRGFSVPRVASNRLLIEFDGTIAQYNAAFGINLHLLHKVVGGDAYQYGTTEQLTMPTTLAPLVAAVLTCDQPADTTPLPGEGGTVTNTPPPGIDNAHTPARSAHSYRTDVLWAAGHTGKGITLGVVVGATFKFKDLRSFWLGLGITRTDPEVVVTMEPISTRYLETTVDTEWAGATAPGARLIVYEGPDVRDTSLVYTFDEAIAQGVANVITDSFAHRETSEPAEIRWQYQRSAKMAAALGISVVAAAGDSNGTDLPAASSWVTAVGGSVLDDDTAGNVIDESTWNLTGVGESLTIPAPSWQAGLPLTHNRRGANDVAMNSATAYWLYWLGSWNGGYTGTSFAAPQLAGMLASIDDARAARGLPPVGCINPFLYTIPAVQQSFRDITSGSAGMQAAGPGWDFPTGWGAPRADMLDSALP